MGGGGMKRANNRALRGYLIAAVVKPIHQDICTYFVIISIDCLISS
jgi:hypothetical protein